MGHPAGSNGTTSQHERRKNPIALRGAQQAHHRDCRTPRHAPNPPEPWELAWQSPVDLPSGYLNLVDADGTCEDLTDLDLSPARGPATPRSPAPPKPSAAGKTTSAATKPRTTAVRLFPRQPHHRRNAPIDRVRTYSCCVAVAPRAARCRANRGLLHQSSIDAGISMASQDSWAI